MIGNNLKQLRKDKGLTLEALADKLNTSKQTIQRYENGVIANIPPQKIEALAKALDTTPSYLMGWNAETPLEKYPNIFSVSKKKLPILGTIACGAPIYAEEEFDGYVSTDIANDADFCLKAKGDSMIGARIYDGDIVFIRSQNFVENGEIGAVIINDEATLKRVYYYPEEGKLVLSAENPRYAPLVYLKSELNNIKIIGKAVAFQSNIL